MKSELELYVLAKELNKDVDEIRQWPLEKIVRWCIALRLMNEEVKKAIPAASTKKHLYVFK